MKETIKYIGRWVIRFILMSIIFSTFQSCAKAVTFEDFKKAVTEKATEVDTQYTRVASQFVNLSSLYNYLSTNNLFYLFDDYNTILIGTGDNRTTVCTLQFCNFDSPLTFSGQYLNYNGNRTRIFAMYRNGSWTIYDPDTQTGNIWMSGGSSINSTYLMLYTSQTIVENNGADAYKYLIQIDINSFLLENEYDITSIDNQEYYILPYTYQNNYTYLGNIKGVTDKMKYFRMTLSQVGGVWIITNEFNNETNNNTNQDFYITNNYDVYIKSSLLNDNLPLFLTIDTFTDSTMTEDVDYIQCYFKTDFMNNSTTSVITNASGDVIGNIDLGEIIDSQQNETNKTNNFLDNLYNQMFTVSGEQIQQIVNTTMDRVQIPSGEIAEIEQIFNYLSGDAGDFVISWTDKTTHFTVNGANISQMTIPARQINFSEMERQSPELQQTMHWARLITNISIFSILIHEAYICLLATLGVPVAIYGQKLEEKQQLAAQQQKQEQAWQNRLEQQRYNDWLYSHRKR